MFAFKSCSWLNFPSADRSVGWCSDVQLQTRWPLARACWSCGIFTLLPLYVLHHHRWKHRNAPCMPIYPLFATRSVLVSHVRRSQASWIKRFSSWKKCKRFIVCKNAARFKKGSRKVHDAWRTSEAVLTSCLVILGEIDEPFCAFLHGTSTSSFLIFLFLFFLPIFLRPKKRNVTTFRHSAHTITQMTRRCNYTLISLNLPFCFIPAQICLVFIFYVTIS